MNLEVEIDGEEIEIEVDGHDVLCEYRSQAHYDMVCEAVMNNLLMRADLMRGDD